MCQTGGCLSGSLCFSDDSEYRQRPDTETEFRLSPIRQFKQFRLWLEHGSELAILRLRMLKLDLTEQLLSWIKIGIALMVGGVCLLTAFISLLFGLHAVLPPEARLWVFFGLSAALLLTALGMFWWLARLWSMQGHFTEDTFHQIAGDIERLRDIPPEARHE